MPWYVCLFYHIDVHYITYVCAANNEMLVFLNSTQKCKLNKVIQIKRTVWESKCLLSLVTYVLSFEKAYFNKYINIKQHN